MNAEGILVFYGALDAGTAVDELRLPVGESALVAGFRIARPLRVIDLTLLVQIEQSLHHFDPDFRSNLSRLVFLRAFGAEISKPVLPATARVDYLAASRALVVRDPAERYRGICEELANHGVRFVDANDAATAIRGGSAPQPKPAAAPRAVPESEAATAAALEPTVTVEKPVTPTTSDTEGATLPDPLRRDRN